MAIGHMSPSTCFHIKIFALKSFILRQRGYLEMRTKTSGSYFVFSLCKDMFTQSKKLSIYSFLWCTVLQVKANYKARFYTIAEDVLCICTKSNTRSALIKYTLQMFKDKSLSFCYTLWKCLYWERLPSIAQKHRAVALRQLSTGKKNSIHQQLLSSITYIKATSTFILGRPHTTQDKKDLLSTRWRSNKHTLEYSTCPSVSSREACKVHGIEVN